MEVNRYARNYWRTPYSIVKISSLINQHLDLIDTMNEASGLSPRRYQNQTKGVYAHLLFKHLSRSEVIVPTGKIDIMYEGSRKYKSTEYKLVPEAAADYVNFLFDLRIEKGIADARIIP